MSKTRRNGCSQKRARRLRNRKLSEMKRMEWSTQSLSAERKLKSEVASYDLQRAAQVESAEDGGGQSLVLIDTMEVAQGYPGATVARQRQWQSYISGYHSVYALANGLRLGGDSKHMETDCCLPHSVVGGDFE